MKIHTAASHLVMIFFILFLCGGCAAFDNAIGAGKLNVPPEFHQKVELEASDNYEMFQAPRSGYDVGDLQSFFTQHTFPALAQDAFKQMFDEVVLVEGDQRITTKEDQVPAIFEVNIIDLGNDIYNESDSYRAVITIAAAMKSPRGDVFWQKAFRGEGLVYVDPQFETGVGPEQAVTDAVRDAIDQMQKAIISAPEVRLHLKHYKDIEAARQAQETKV